MPLSSGNENNGHYSRKERSDRQKQHCIRVGRLVQVRYKATRGKNNVTSSIYWTRARLGHT